MFVVGAGRIGTALAQRALAAGVACSLVTRTEGWDALDTSEPGPVLIAVRNDDLAAVLDRMPPHRLAELVFIQNGMLRPWLRERRMNNVTRGLLFFAVASRGAPVAPGKPSPFTGPFAPVVVHWLGSVGIAAVEVDPLKFAAVELEKLIWNSAFGLLCEVWDVSVGEVCDRHGDALRALTEEFRVIGRKSMGVELDLEFLLGSLVAYSRTIADYQGAVKEWPWRNGWFADEATRLGVATPVHTALLERVGRSGP